MEIKRLLPSGYCKGVINAIEIAKKTRINNPEANIFVLGMLVHNDYVSKELAQMNIITLDDSNKTKEELIDEIDDGIIIFTAHGVKDSIKEKVINKGLKYADASCVDVIKTQTIIKEYLDLGYDILYFGKKHHPEAEAVLAIDNKIHLLTNVSDLDNLQITNQKLLFTNQTTMSQLELKDLIEKVKIKFPNIIIQDEICSATSSRQLAIINEKDCDLLYVVGDNKSNNTNKLVEIAKNIGIKKVFLISNYQDINIKDFIGINKICVSAGASTPLCLINETIDYLKKQFSD